MQKQLQKPSQKKWRVGNRLVKNFSSDQKEKQLIQKISQVTNKLRQWKEKNNKGISIVSLRRARTRTLIQLGGLIEKANLLHPLEISLGDDLQKDETCFDNVATLMGALADIYPTLQKDKTQKMLWQEKGKKLLS